MTDPVVLLGVTLLVTLTAYGLLGGADYGGGLWDLLAAGPTAARQRATIARAIGPVWEANHVWLIVAVVIVFTGLPRAFAALSTMLHVPIALALVGIVLRGSAFVFRAYGPPDPRTTRLWGRVFAIASTVTPVCLGVVVGAITEGRLPETPTGSFVEVYLHPWMTPFALLVGAFALSLFGYLAAVYLTMEAREADVRAAFRSRALASGVVVAIIAASVIAVATPEVRRGLLASPWAVPLHLATAASATIAFVSLWRGRYWLARIAAAGQVTLILWGWALAQFPYAIRPQLTLAGAAAPTNVIVMLLQVLGLAAIALVPSLVYLFRIFGPRGDGTRSPA